jgi:hypothetical protein
MNLSTTIRALRLSGWPRTAIRLLLRSNHPELSRTWISQQVRNESKRARRAALANYAAR